MSTLFLSKGKVTIQSNNVSGKVTITKLMPINQTIIDLKIFINYASSSVHPCVCSVTLSVTKNLRTDTENTEKTQRTTEMMQLIPC